MAKEFRGGSTVDGFYVFLSDAAVGTFKLIISMVATTQPDCAAWIGGEEHECIDRDVARRHQQSVLSRSEPIR